MPPPLDRTTPILFDAACLIAAAGSTTGASSYLMQLCEQRFLTGVVSRPILSEAARNVRAKLPPAALRRFDRLRRRTPLQVVSISRRAQEPYQRLVNDKDVHVLTAAILASAPFIVTLDVSFAGEVNAADVPVEAFSPAVFIATVLPHHADYAELNR